MDINFVIGVGGPIFCVISFLAVVIWFYIGARKEEKEKVVLRTRLKKIQEEASKKIEHLINSLLDDVVAEGAVIKLHRLQQELKKLYIENFLIDDEDERCLLIVQGKSTIEVKFIEDNNRFKVDTVKFL